jgi:TRAP transporter TAXI family solute receptor
MKRQLALLAAGLMLFAAAATAQPRNLTLGTATVGGTYFVYGGVVAKLLSDKLGILVSTQQTQGTNHNVILVSEKRVDLGMTTVAAARQAWNGTGGWTGGRKFTEIRALFPMYDTPFHFVALKKSGIRRVKDLAGRKVGVGPRGGTCGTYFPLMFKRLKVPMTVRFGQAADLANQLSDGLLDGFAFCAGLPIAAFRELENSKEVTFFTFTARDIDRIKKALPEMSDAVVPKGTYDSLSEDHKTVGVYNVFIAHKDLDGDTAYRITKAVLENNADMINGHAAAKETVIANWDKNTFLPYHAGAVRYYAERGIKIPDKLQ